jgi:hypothetical protein
MSLEMLLRVVIAALAAYRVARMIAMEDGPFDCFSRFRSKFDKPRGTPRNWIERGVECPLCLGAYTSAVMLGLSYLDYAVYGVVWLAVSGLQVAIQKQERE